MYGVRDGDCHMGCCKALGFLTLCCAFYLVFSHEVNTTQSDSALERRKSSVVGLVLARCGSKGIPLKNLAKIGTQTLLRRTLKTLFTFGKFSSIWVATDCNEVEHEARLSGAQVYRRSVESAVDTAPSLIAVQEFIKMNTNAGGIALFQCTSPFLALPFIHSAYSLFVKDSYDSVFSVTRQHKLRWKLIADGQAVPLNFDPAHRPRRQDWEGELIETGMFYFIRTRLINRGVLQGGRISVVEVPGNCSLEIDCQADLDAAAMRAPPIGPTTC